MSKMWLDVSSKIDMVSDNVEKKLTQMLNQMVDKRVNLETSKMKKDVTREIS